MATFALEIMLILVAAFAAGCVVGCVSRGRLGREKQASASKSDS